MYRIISWFVLLFCVLPLAAQEAGGGGEGFPKLKTNGEALQNWQKMRFGMFIHWGPVSLRGTEIGWSRGRNVPIAEYDQLYQEFNPVLFDAKAWVGLAKAAGMKYLIITSKHHDGFCLWDSEFTDYDMLSTPFKRDILAELSAECERQGILFGTYYSIADWRHPDYTTRYGGDSRSVEIAEMQKYRIYLKNQVRELVEKYHTHILWFDGEWEAAWTHADGMNLYKFCRDLDDAILINNRVDKGRSGMKGMTRSHEFAGDFGTPEQEIGNLNPLPWESCITLGQQWAWKPNDVLKSRDECLRTLIQTAGGNGNLLLNVAPMLDGRIELRQQQRLREIGDWLEQNGTGFYNTHGGPFHPTRWLAATHRGDSVFVHLLRWPGNELALPALPEVKILACRLLNGEELDFYQREKVLRVKIPSHLKKEMPVVILLKLDRLAEKIEPLAIPPELQPFTIFREVRLTHPPAEKYAARGAATLEDGEFGSLNFHDPNWLGFEQDDFEVVLELGQLQTGIRIETGFLQNQEALVFLPRKVEFFVSSDGKDYALISSKNMEVKPDTRVSVQKVSTELTGIPVRFVKIVAQNQQTCLEWHVGVGGKTWLLVDEVVIDSPAGSD